MLLLFSGAAVAIADNQHGAGPGRHWRLSTRPMRWTRQQQVEIEDDWALDLIDDDEFVRLS